VRQFLKVLLLGALALTGAFARPAAGQGPHIHPLDIEVRGNEVWINFLLGGAVDPDLAHRIESGLETTIDYDIRLYERNRYWFDQFLESHRFRVTAAYDAVRREYLIRDFWDGESAGIQTARDFDEAVRLLVSRQSLFVGRVRKDWPHKHLYVKMRASYDSGHFFALAPVDYTTVWKKSKTFKIHDADLK
jgi:hypothetical protein